ncbi:hypothetical protein QJS04_geneDACA007339 [Acorus gramineus]|uniref:Uncharacterized protein n=1 Tax=Acorus gramineus TaxID=55184 RepID=A0AAV9BPB9_ACOGR|nr:hypothetical protein QJS04_geneDACA007339 [Acorus gramineus]
MLAVEKENNYKRMMRLVGIAGLVNVLKVNFARILRNLCNYSRLNSCFRLKGIFATLLTILKAMMTGKEKLPEVFIGLATQMFE